MPQQKCVFKGLASQCRTAKQIYTIYTALFYVWFDLSIFGESNLELLWHAFLYAKYFFFLLCLPNFLELMQFIAKSSLMDELEFFYVGREFLEMPSGDLPLPQTVQTSSIHLPSEFWLLQLLENHCLYSKNFRHAGS